jgi:tight adherence protein B
MDILLTLAIAICGYVVMILLFPKLAPDGGSDYTKQALERIYQETHAPEDAEISILKEQLGEESTLVRWLFAPAFMKPLYEAAMQSGYNKDLNPFVMLIAASALGGGMACLLLGFSWPLALLMALLLGYLIPYRHCQKKVRARNRAFIEHFPDALDMIVRSVKSGFPLNTAIQMLAENTEEPLRSEFRQVVDEIQAGRTISQSLARLASRINEQDVKFFAVVLAVQQETGGNLAETISNLSGILRKRKQLRGKMRAMTSEGRATAWVLGSLPVFVFTIIYVMQPGYLAPFFNDALGATLLGVAVVLIALCIFVVKQMINIDI